LRCVLQVIRFSVDRVFSVRIWLCVLGMLALSLGLAGCGATTPEAVEQTSPLARVSPLSTPTFSPTPVPAPTLTPVPAPTLTPTPLPGPTFTPTAEAVFTGAQWVVLHTNDNWGETEPCG
jgi:hypothetical protein